MEEQNRPPEIWKQRSFITSEVLALPDWLAPTGYEHLTEEQIMNLLPEVLGNAEALAQEAKRRGLFGSTHPGSD